jgi:archaellum biogenesis protein FlaJ (TadC family)
MAERISQQDLARIATITDAPTRTRVERTFGLPTGLYAVTVAAYLGFIGVMALSLMNPGLVLPMVIFAFFIVAGFGLPMIWVRMKPDSDAHALTFAQFSNRGIDTLTGHLSASQASVQVLILPLLVLAWGIACSLIIALT